MKEKEIEAGSTNLAVRMMDESYIIGEDERKAGIEFGVYCRQYCPVWPNLLYATYYRKIIGAYEIGPVIIWEHKRIVGFLPVSVVGCGIPELPHCIQYTGGLAFGAEKHIDLKMINEAKAIPFNKLSPKEIRIGCMTVNPAYKGKNLGAAMVELIIDTAREKGLD